MPTSSLAKVPASRRTKERPLAKSAENHRMRLAILELESDGAYHLSAAIDAHLRSVFSPAPNELAVDQTQPRRDAFDDKIDWVKAALAEDKLHEVVGSSEGQRVYRITPHGRDELAKAGRNQELRDRGRDKDEPGKP
jgi:hypothetical protein